MEEIKEVVAAAIPNVMPSNNRRLAFRLGDHIPKGIRWLYYIVLFGTLIYLLWMLIVWFLKTLQKIGYFVFSPKNYWTCVMCFIILTVGGLIVAQVFLGLDPIGNVINSFEELISEVRQEIGGVIAG